MNKYEDGYAKRKCFPFVFQFHLIPAYQTKLQSQIFPKTEM